MTTQPFDPRSEHGIALIVVLLLMAVLSGLATGFAMNGRVEVAMASNESYYAGARAAAEAGINRATEAIRADTTHDLLSGFDGVVDELNAAAAANADNGDIGYMLNGAPPYALAGEYTYSIEIFDDDDPQLYTTALSNDQLIAMGNEDGTGFVDLNDQLILRATGFGPGNTMVRISRRILSQENITVTPPTEANPAILVDGDLNITGNITVEGDEGNIHANGDMTISGNAAGVSGDATATGDFTANDGWHAGGTQGGGKSNINVPEIHASNYIGHADFILHDDGTVTLGDGVSGCGGSCPTGWTWSGTTWSSDNDISAGTFYVETSVTMSGNPGKKGAELAVSVISEGSISITGTPKFKPENDEKLQFVTEGDLIIAGNVDLDDPTAVEGQILVREQISISGNPEFQGRILVQNADDEFDDVTTNSISGNPTITYNGTLGAIPVPGATLTDYTNNITGWMEQ